MHASCLLIVSLDLHMSPCLPSRQPVMYSFCSCCQTVGLPHPGGRVPDRQLWSVRLEPSSRNPRAGQEPLLPQNAGSVPVRGISSSSSVTREGNALPQLAGKVPVWHIHCSHKAVHGVRLCKTYASEQNLRDTNAHCSESWKASKCNCAVALQHAISCNVHTVVRYACMCTKCKEQQLTFV